MILKKNRKSFSYCKPLLYAYCNMHICDISIISIVLIYTLILFPSCIIFSVIKLNIQTTIYHAMKVNGDQGRLQSPFTFIKRTAWTFTRSDRQTRLVYHDKVKLNQLWNYWTATDDKPFIFEEWHSVTVPKINIFPLNLIYILIWTININITILINLLK